MRLALLLGSWLVVGQPAGLALEDRIDVIHVDRKVLAVTASGSFLELDLEIGEQVLDTRSRGLVGVVTTSARLLGVTSNRTSWHELRYRVKEREAAPSRIYLGDTVALVPFKTRLVAIGPQSGQWDELALGPGESLQSVFIETNLAAVVTQRRVIAFAPDSGGYVTLALSPQEEIESSSKSENSLTLMTARRILVFQVGAPRWLERNRHTRF